MRTCLRLGPLVLSLVLAGCSGGSDDGDGGMDGSVDLDSGTTECGPSTCGACGEGFRNDDECVDGAWECSCVPFDAGLPLDADPGDAGADAGPSDAGTSDGGTSDAGPDAGTGGGDGGATDAGPMSCEDDDGCPSDAWCRPTMVAGTNACHPYAEEGDSCGGFVLPWSAERCDPSLGCISPNPLLADAPGVCAIAVTVAQLLASPETYDGRVVAVLDGWVLGSIPGCTRILCSDDMPCCNSCNSGELLTDSESASSGVTLRNESSVAYQCMGDNCTPYDSCTVAVDAAYRVIGTFVASGTFLDVSSIQALPSLGT